MKIRSLAGPVALAGAALALSGCGTTFADRALSGAGIGAGVGVVAGPVGVGAGAVVGGVAGAVIPEENVNLGTPVWKR